MSEDYSRLEDILQPTMDELDAIASRGGVEPRRADRHPRPRRAHQRPAGRPDDRHRGPTWCRQGARARHPVATPTGWTTMGEIAVGDPVMGSDGRPTTVVAATDVMTDRPCYEVHFSDGSVIVADAQHQWLTDTRASRKSAQAARHRLQPVPQSADVRRGADDGGDRANRSLRDQGRPAQPLGHERRSRSSFPPPTCPCRPTPWASGSATEPRRPRSTPARTRRSRSTSSPKAWSPSPRAWTVGTRCACPPVRRSRRALAPCAGTCSCRRPRRCRRAARPVGPRSAAVEASASRPPAPTAAAPRRGWRSARRAATSTAPSRRSSAALGVLNTKHIPTQYLRASEAQRRALLAGLLDTDGTVAPNGVVQFAVTSRRLAEDARELVASLGHRVRHDDQARARAVPRTPRSASP